jgi:hypothetical protein
VDVVEVVLHRGVVHREAREREHPLGVHRLEAGDPGGRLLTTPEDPLEDIRVRRVHLRDQLTAIIEDDLGPLGLQQGVLCIRELLIGHPLPGVGGDRILGIERVDDISVCRLGLTRGERDGRPRCGERLDEHAAFGLEVRRHRDGEPGEGGVRRMRCRQRL